MNIFETQALIAVTEEIVPPATFFKDRYFPTTEADIFTTDKVLTEYRKGDRKMAAFVDDRVGDIPVERRGFSIHEYSPAKIAPSRVLTLDDLKKRGFGEALYANSTQAERAMRLIAEDLTDLAGRIARREEWMAVQTMINNACTMQTFIDANTQGSELYVKFFDSTSDHTYTVGDEWNDTNGDFFGDVQAMCRMLSRRGLKAADLILGAEAADAVLKIDEVRELLNKTSGIIIGEIEQTLEPYDGVSYMGNLNFGGFRLNLFSADTTYADDNGVSQSYFPSKSAMVTAPKCGHTMYGSVTQIDFGSSEYATYAMARVPKLVVNQNDDIRKFRLTSRPLTAPLAYCPYIYAANVVL